MLSADEQKINAGGNFSFLLFPPHTVELQWLQHLCNYENMFKTGEVQANECLS